MNPRLALRIDDCWWNPLRETVIVQTDNPAGLEEVAVVVAAQQDEVVDVRQPTFVPFQDVMAFAVLRSDLAPGNVHPPSRSIKM